MRRAWIATSFILLAIFATTIPFAIQHKMFDAIGPGPGFFPFWLATIGAVLSLLLLVQTARGGDLGPVELLPPFADSIRPLSVLVGLALVAGAFDTLGYRIASTIFIVGLLVAMGVRTWWLIVLLAALGSFGIFHVFYFWLQVPLPYGVFGI